MNQSNPMPGLLHDDHVLHRISEELAAKFDGVFSPEMVDRYVFESYTALARTARIKTYLTSITRHFALDRLNALAHSQGIRPSGVPEVLFVCVQNAGRSQMAAGLLRLHASDRINVRSAGSLPAEHLNDNVVASMKELGIDLRQEFPKPLTDDVVRAADVVITMGCGDTCPIYPGKRYEDWHIEDPADLPLSEVGRVRDELDGRIKRLVGELL
ncbi:arsenate reductase ArsC [Arthrobacter sp. H5]|uniref:arsenate reductase ArsC n=1 Tax=Arthrobacter sp. H5 TaxID=1267973 RepID=UPI000481D8EA|nr:arsenate reductase ArsC [Arthrobacter sp. H5]